MNNTINATKPIGSKATIIIYGMERKKKEEWDNKIFHHLLFTFVNKIEFTEESVMKQSSDMRVVETGELMALSKAVNIPNGLIWKLYSTYEICR